MLDLEVTNHDNICLVEVRGRVDSSNADDLGSVLMSEIEAGHIQIVLDLAGVDYMSSAGLREIVAALKQVQGTGDVRIAQPSYRVREVLEMAGLDTVLQIFPTQTEALSSY